MKAIQSLVLVGRTETLFIFDTADIALPPRMAQLQDVLAIVFMNAAAELTPKRNSVVALDERISGHDSSPKLHRNIRRDDRPDSALRELQLPVDARLISRAVVVVETARNVRPENAVLDGQIPELQRSEDGVLRHRGLPILPRCWNAGRFYCRTSGD